MKDKALMHKELDVSLLYLYLLQLQLTESVGYNSSRLREREKKSKILDFYVPPQPACSSTYHSFRPIKA